MLGGQEDWECSIFLHRSAQARGSESLGIPVTWRLTVLMLDGTTQAVLSLESSHHRTGLLLALMWFSKQITSKAILFNITSESSELLFLLNCLMKYILKLFGSSSNR